MIDKQVVGTLNVRFLENKEAWLEAVRVHPNFRQRGVASLLVQAAHEYAKRRKCRTSRLETSLRNTAGRATFEKFGYRRVAWYDTYKVDAQAGSLAGIRPAKVSDLKACWEMWQACDSISEQQTPRAPAQASYFRGAS